MVGQNNSSLALKAKGRVFGRPIRARQDPELMMPKGAAQSGAGLRLIGGAL
jgi:hypothetical protein